tara:strand:+ start:262 stop:726 length:465 start_codon:yes stop_codon:yes gene_type:complete
MNILDKILEILSDDGVHKMNKRDTILEYYRSNPEVSIKNIASKTNASYGYVRNVIALEKPKALIKYHPPSLDELMVQEGHISDGSTAAYYELPVDATELQDLISHKDMNAQIGEIFRAAYRYGESSHSTQLRDAKKIKFYIDAEINRLERNTRI